VTIAPPLKGGEDFAGKSGRKTANACEANAMETSVIAAAHFMSGGLNKIQTRGKKIFSGEPRARARSKSRAMLPLFENGSEFSTFRFELSG
jgi:hypothetical protein